MIISFALSTIEKILNRYLHLDPDTKQRLAPVAGKVVMVDLQYFGCTLYFLLTLDGIHLLDHYAAPVDVTLRGTPLDFLRLSFSKSNAALFESGIVVTGDTEVAQQFKAIFAHLDIDWEEQLSHVMGDVLAHQVGNFFRALSAWAKQSTDTVQQNTGEYLQEELRLLPSRAELQDFFTEVDQLRNDVDRLEMRVHRLQAHFAQAKD